MISHHLCRLQGVALPRGIAAVGARVSFRQGSVDALFTKVVAAGEIVRILQEVTAAAEEGWGG